jgi:hypothetical protein
MCQEHVEGIGTSAGCCMRLLELCQRDCKENVCMVSRNDVCTAFTHLADVIWQLLLVMLLKDVDCQQCQSQVYHSLPGSSGEVGN